MKTILSLINLADCKLEVPSKSCCNGEIKFMDAVIMASKVVSVIEVDLTKNKPIISGITKPIPFRGPVQNMTRL